MKFKFQFEKVLNHKKILEDQARKDFSEFEAKLREQHEFLNGLEADLQKAYSDKHLITQMGGEISAHLSHFHEFYIAQKKLIEQQKKIIQGLERITEEKRQLLVEAVKEHKIFTKLKEKRKQEFRKELNRRDQKRSDEINIMRFTLKERL